MKVSARHGEQEAEHNADDQSHGRTFAAPHAPQVNATSYGSVPLAVTRRRAR
jgi:hypothetical protein